MIRRDLHQVPRSVGFDKVGAAGGWAARVSAHGKGRFGVRKRSLRAGGWWDGLMYFWLYKSIRRTEKGRLGARKRWRSTVDAERSIGLEGKQNLFDRSSERSIRRGGKGRFGARKRSARAQKRSSIRTKARPAWTQKAKHSERSSARSGGKISPLSKPSRPTGLERSVGCRSLREGSHKGPSRPRRRSDAAGTKGKFSKVLKGRLGKCAQRIQKGCSESAQKEVLCKAARFRRRPVDLRQASKALEKVGGRLGEGRLRKGEFARLVGSGEKVDRLEEKVTFQGKPRSCMLIFLDLQIGRLKEKLGRQGWSARSEVRLTQETKSWVARGHEARQSRYKLGKESIVRRKSLIKVGHPSKGRCAQREALYGKQSVNRLTGEGGGRAVG
ncbi:hypothetical protein BDZ88DRAFT_473404 [Geranomyces variabilis]|nr:hypothetical protein BDZ88DRAFT_473404 [Geranomyces variabilis]